MNLIVGLGNPGLFYGKNRHNLGFMFIKKFSGDNKIQLDKKQGGARTGKGNIEGIDVILAKPQTYMNESGLAVKRLLDKFKLKPSDLIIIQDDMDLSLGKLRLSCGGGAGGHNGVQSVINETGSPAFTRLRIGVGRPAFIEGADNSQIVIDYVLSNFSAYEKKEIDKALPQATEALLTLLKDGPERAMNLFN